VSGYCLAQSEKYIRYTMEVTSLIVMRCWCPISASYKTNTISWSVVLAQ